MTEGQQTAGDPGGRTASLGPQEHLWEAQQDGTFAAAGVHHAAMP